VALAADKETHTQPKLQLLAACDACQMKVSAHIELHSVQLMTAFKPCMPKKLVTGTPPALRTMSCR
jgi:hypothetical protein